MNRFSWKSAARIVLFLLACAATVAASAPLAARWQGPSSMLALGTWTALITYGLTAVFARWDRMPLPNAGAVPVKASVVRLALGFTAGLALAALQSLLVAASGQAHWVLSEPPGASTVCSTLLAYFMLACREEVAFHGYPLFRLKQLTGTIIAQFLIAFSFAVEHIAGGYTWKNALLGAALGSLAFGMAALATEGLAVPIGLHAAWNFGQWVLGGKELPGFWRVEFDPSAQSTVDAIGLISYDGLMLAALIGFWALYRRQSLSRPATSGPEKSLAVR